MQDITENAESYSEPCQTFKMERFAAKHSILGF